MSDVRKILVVEDETLLREIIVSLLGENGHSVREATNGVEALKILTEESFSLILSDIRMPEMDGLELITQITASGIVTPVVFITAFGDYANMLTALRLGAFDFIRKPFFEKEVLSVVDRAIEVGYRKNKVLEEILELNPKKREAIQKHNRMVALLQITNNKKRANA